MKQYDVETTVTYKTWVRVDADDEKTAERKVKDMAWDMTRIQYQTMVESEPTGTVRDVG
mgnify:FL=1|jgi:hypothetical protein|tara:strand:+ start:674 stop:850 length:177 start_codon:yes stop_codon:yes gene_type:complete